MQSVGHIAFVKKGLRGKLRRGKNKSSSVGEKGKVGIDRSRI